MYLILDTCYTESMFERIYTNATILGDKLAILNGNKKISYSDLKRELDQKQDWYKQQFKNSNVGVVAGNLWETVVVILLAAQCNSRVVLLGDSLKKNELDYYIQNLLIDTVFITEDKMKEFCISQEGVVSETGLNRLKCIQGNKSHLENVGEDVVYKEKDYIIQLTSGSEGIRKAAARSEESLKYEIVNTCKSVDFSSDNVFLTIPPISHSYGLVLGLLLPLYMGKTVILLETFDPNLIETYLIEHRIDVLLAVPFMYHILNRRILKNKGKISLAKCFSAGGLLDEETAKEFYGITGINIWNDYGSTETGVICLEMEGKSNRVGKVVEGVKIAVLDPEDNDVAINKRGVIHVASESFGRGYVFPYSLNKEKFINGFYCTGDVGWIDEGGVVSIEGRQDDFFIVGGEKTSATEIKNNILLMNDIFDVEVVSEKKLYIGDVIVAYIVKNKGSYITEKDVINHCDEIMEKYKVPKKIYFVQEIPKNTNGKVLRKHLTDLYTKENN